MRSNFADVTSMYALSENPLKLAVISNNPADND